LTVVFDSRPVVLLPAIVGGEDSRDCLLMSRPIPRRRRDASKKRCDSFIERDGSDYIR